MKKEAINRTVYFIGAGPGDPDLITVKAAKILERADAVVVDRLVSSSILQQYVNADAKIISVGKQGHCSTSPTQSEINELLISLAKEYHCLVRLKGGDTAFFSNIMDELAALNQHHISYEIIPGITAASGASAYTGVPLTARGYASGVKFLSYCNHAKISEEEWKCLAEMENTLVWYMTSQGWPSVARKLILSGAELHIPLLVVEQASTPQQYVHQFLLKDFLNLDSAVQDDKAMQDFESESLLMGADHSQKVKAAPIKSDYGSKDCVDLSSSTAESRLNEKINTVFVSPSIIIVGKVAALYDQFSWYRNQSDRSPYFQPLQNVTNAYA